MYTNMKKKVSEIEFRITNCEIDDCVVRMADLIKDGYTVSEFHSDSVPFIGSAVITEPYIHILMRRKFENE